ncbi:MAG: class I SAM-dependent methyltransferase [Patescibacteria group bacterium]
MIRQLKSEKFMYSHFIDGIISGQFRKIPLENIRKIARERYFGFTPLTELSREEDTLLENLLIKQLYSTLNRDDLELLCGPVYIREEKDDHFINLYLENEIPDNHGKKLRLISPMEKIDIFFNPHKWLKIRINKPRFSSDVTRYGNRNLLGEDSYFRNTTSPDEFRNLLKSIRRQSGSEYLTVLDIGCGMGLALRDMKDLDSNLRTHGITMEQEPAMFNANYFHYLFAERMPLEFREKFHLIVSNMSFRYFLFPHRALQNTVKSLAKGGYARIIFSYDSIPETGETREYFLKQVPNSESNYKAMKVLIGKTIAELEILKKEGEIRFTTDDNFYNRSMQGRICIEKISY